MKRLALLCLALALALAGAAALAEQSDAGLVLFEYGESGGMENRSFSYTLAREGLEDEATLTVDDNGAVKTRVLPPSAMSELADYMAGFHPEGWEALPLSELIALDAPTERITLIYADGTIYAVSDDRELEQPLFYNATHFLESYLAEDAETFELTLPAAGNGATAYRASLSAPEAAWLEERIGADGRVILVLHGRMPGQVTLTVEAGGPGDGAAIETYPLTVDRRFNISLFEEDDDPFGAREYADPEDFYDDYRDEFDDYDEAEAYYYERVDG